MTIADSRRTKLRRRALVPCVAALIVLIGCGNPAGRADLEQPARTATEEERAIAAAVEATYEAYSFERGEPPCTEAILRHFTPNARVSYVRGDSVIARPVEAYFAAWRRNVVEQETELLREWETYGETEWFGDIAHHVSAFAFQQNTADSITARGVMSFQLVKVQGEWLVHSMMWKTAADGEGLPSRYVDR